LHAVLASLALLPVSMAPAWMYRDWGGVVYAAGALALGCGLLLCAFLFLVTLSDRSARRLLRASLIYLPALFALLLLTPLL
jgi:protoheme IX farnesyltransferase